jgi:dimethylargininase
VTATEATGTRFGVRCMTAPLRRALLVEPAAGDFAGAGWTAEPDVDVLRRDHAALVDLLAGLGVEVTVVAAPDGLVDACYPYDPVFVTGSGFIELRMAKPARADEPPFLAGVLADTGVERLGGLSGDARADGGDMLWLDEQTLGVARGYRTNRAAHEQLGDLLAPQGVQVERVDLACAGGPKHLLHLLSVVSPVASDLAVAFEPLCPVPLLEALDERGVRRIQCAEEELGLQGCNVLTVRPGVVVLADTCPGTRRALERAGCETHVYPAAELNKGEGGPTCLTRPILRG